MQASCATCVARCGTAISGAPLVQQYRLLPDASTIALFCERCCCRFRTKVGRGSRFYFSLPYLRAPRAPSTPEVPPVGSSDQLRRIAHSSCHVQFVARSLTSRHRLSSSDSRSTDFDRLPPFRFLSPSTTSPTSSSTTATGAAFGGSPSHTHPSVGLTAQSVSSHSDDGSGSGLSHLSGHAIGLRMPLTVVLLDDSTVILKSLERLCHAHPVATAHVTRDLVCMRHDLQLLIC